MFRTLVDWEDRKVELVLQNNLMKFLTLTSFLNLSNFLSDIVSKKKKKRSDYNQIRSAGKIYKIIRQYSKYISIATEVPDKHLNKQIKYKMHIFFFLLFETKTRI